MKTLVLTVDEHGQGGYVIRLFEYDGPLSSLEAGNEQAVSYIPADLSLAEPLVNPETGEELDGQRLRELFLGQRASSPLFRSIGEYLTRLLLSGPVGTEWRRLSELYPGEQSPSAEGRRLFLDIRPATLRVLPWELMTAPGEDGVPLALDLLNPILRGNPRPQAPPADFTWPLHAMIVVGTPDKTIMADAEIDAVKETLCRLDRPVELEVLKWPSYENLVRAVQSFRPHVFHFIGHGRAAPGGEEPVLEFADEHGNPGWRWSAEMIKLDLQGWRPHFACLNACRSAVGATEQRKVWDIAEAFIDAGVPSVVGMQADVPGDSAARLPAKLYEAVLTGVPIDLALARARDDIRRKEINGLARRDWALAALHVRGDPGRVLTGRPQEPTLRLLDSVAEFAEVKGFVDRKEPRRSLQQSGSPPAGGPHQSLLIVEGEEDTGKTWLVYWCLKVWAWRGLNLKYVDLGQPQPGRLGGTKSLLGVMRGVQSGKAHGYLQRPLPPPAFSEFDRLVASVLDSARARVAAAPGAAPLDEDELLSAVDEDEIWKMCEAFRDALREAAGGKPLIIALDNLNVRPDHAAPYLVPGLIRPVALHMIAPVKMILVVSRRQYGELGLASLRNASAHVEVPVLRDQKFDEFAEEFFRYHHFDPKTAGSLIAIMKSQSAAGTDYKPANFWRLLQGLRGY